MNVNRRVFVGECLFVFPLCGFSLSLFCNYVNRRGPASVFSNAVLNTHGLLESHRSTWNEEINIVNRIKVE